MKKTAFLFLFLLTLTPGKILAQQQTAVPSSDRVRYQLWGTWPTVLLLDTWTGRTWELKTVIKDGPVVWLDIERADTPEQAMEIIKRHERIAEKRQRESQPSP
jgi:hypothetical protein